jgi:energy-coupling factor transporter ATP-binding protein EcfA2
MLDFTSLEILPECKYRKNFKPGKYEFWLYGVKNFYGENVTLHALVGKNGSGKSSLLDLVLRIMNNVGALLCKQEARNASEHVNYVRHIFTDLSYKKSTMNSQQDTNIIHQGKICVRDTVLWIEYDKARRRLRLDSTCHRATVLYTVEPIFRSSEPSKEQCEELASCYRECLALADRNGLQSVVFCCISTGVFGFPQEPFRAHRAARYRRTYLVRMNRDYPESELLRARFLPFTEDISMIFKRLTNDTTKQ